MTFLPEGYEVPKTGGGGYMKFNLPANKFRILSAPVMGFVYWNDKDKPVRMREYPKTIPADIRRDKKGNAEKIKHFWTMVVWNFSANEVVHEGKKVMLGEVQILEITQSTIQNALNDLITAEEWGDPRGYSLTVNRKGEGLETEYSVVPSPAQATPEDILRAYKEKAINLDALFAGGNPFDGSAAEVTPEEVDDNAKNSEPAF